MIETGKISAEEGARLLEALEQATSRDEKKGQARAARWFRVKVTDLNTGKTKVNMNIPIGLVGVGMRMGAKFAPDLDSSAMDEMLKAAHEGSPGKIIDVEDTEGGEHVEIYVE
jgi:hypothetical protein